VPRFGVGVNGCGNEQHGCDHENAFHLVLHLLTESGRCLRLARFEPSQLQIGKTLR
jgi:hypothetical protein